MAILTPLPSEPGARRRLCVSSPATLDPIGEIEIQTADDVRYAVAAARKVQPAWDALGVDERARCMRRALRVVLERQDEIVDVVVRESGKPPNEARMMAVFSACDSLTFHAKHARRALKPEKRSGGGLPRLGKRVTVFYRPLGVVGVISPWNAPFTLALHPTVQALVAGNAVVIKPSEFAPLSGRLVGEIFRAAGLPDGVLTVLTGDGETGASLCESGVDKISFTGSVETGRRVAEACARRLIPCTLDLAGKDPMIVCADADLDRAAAGAVVGAFWNGGQHCCSTERVYAVAEIAGAFTDRVVRRVAELRQGASGEFDVGAIFQEHQLEIIEAHVAEAVAKGAQIRAGGRRNPHLEGLFYEPTVLTEVTQDMKIMREETFGPVLPIMRVRDEDEAIRYANDSRYGLGASIWSRDWQRAFQLARRVESGSVCINDMMLSRALSDVPFGGRKESGLGRLNGIAGLRAYCCAQPITRDRSGGKSMLGHYPYTRRRDQALRRLLRLYYGSPLGRWLS